jgi:hypothetical protein
MAIFTLSRETLGPPNATLSSMSYNFGRVHQTLPVTPEWEARIADHVWSMPTL